MKEKWMGEHYFVAPANFAPEATKDFNFPANVELHDVTLRDGEQQPGVVFTKQDKINVAKMLDDVGVHRIEAGMPAVSQSDFEAFQEISKLGLKSKIFAFSRAMASDIDLAFNAGVDGVVVEIPSNDELIQYGYRWSLDRPLKAAVDACKLAHEKGLYVNLFLMDSSRLMPERFVEMVKHVQDNGWVDSCSIVDTQGVLSFQGAKHFVAEAVRGLDIPVEAHFHNDLGCGTANALAAFEAGASVLHTTMLGLGPRAGQGATEQVAIALKLLYDYDCGVKLDHLYELGRKVADIARVHVPGNQPVVGDVIYQIEAGMPATWWQYVEKDYPLSLYGVLPGVMGQPPVSIVLGKGSGTSSILYHLEKNNIVIESDEIVKEILSEVKEQGIEKKRGLTQEEFLAIVDKYNP